LIGDAHDSGPLTGAVRFTVVNYDDTNSEYSFDNLVIRSRGLKSERGTTQWDADQPLIR
jgi:hypothetical protein